MNSSDYHHPRPSPRRELQLQGPRPAPLKVCKDSFKIKKLPAAAMPPTAATSAPPQPPRPPVIIYTVSPKIIHTSPRGFMSLVQRLTGPSSSSLPSPSVLLSSATTTSRNKVLEDLDQLGIGLSSRQGILSPMPSSIQPIPSSFFTNTEFNNLNLFQEQQSPAFHGDNTFLVSPNNLLGSPAVPSPGAYWDLFNHYQDF